MLLKTCTTWTQGREPYLAARAEITDVGQLDQKMLSRREREVLTMIGQGQSSRQIAEQLHIAVNTVSRHRQNILQTLKVQNTAVAVEIATRLHLLLH